MSKAFARRPLQTISVLTLAATTCLVHDRANAQVPETRAADAAMVVGWVAHLAHLLTVPAGL